MNSRAEVYNALQSISEIGDQDECSIKHVGYALEAIQNGLTWRDGDDYPDPGYPMISKSAWTEIDNGAEYEDFIPDGWAEFLDQYLELKWAIVQDIYDEVGPEQFQEIMWDITYYMSNNKWPEV